MAYVPFLRISAGRLEDCEVPAKMCEITRSNYELKYDEMLKAIEDANFIAFDAEFTLLSVNNGLDPSLSDTAEIRYTKLRKSVGQSVMSQFGIAAFVPNKETDNSYLVRTFNCFLFPQSYGIFDVRFFCQASSIEFLCDNNFNFNKFFYEGVPYLNKDQEKVIRRAHQFGRLKHTFDSMRMRNVDANKLKDLRDSISVWRSQVRFGEAKEFTVPVEGAYRYILLADLKERFDDIKCKFTNYDKIRITKTNDPLEVKQSFKEELERLFQAHLGFSRIIQAISALKKPIVGHNCLLDLLHIFDKFHKPLPEKYKDFKKQLHDLFPVIYDTKNLSFSIRKVMKNKTNLFQETGLVDLHNMLDSDKGKFVVLCSPNIEHAHGYEKYVKDGAAHEAGYDAYLTGYVFIRMAHFLAAKDIRSTEIQPLTFGDHLAAVKYYENCINIARASLRYLNFGGKDPPTARRSSFIVTLRRNNTEPLSANEIAHEFLPFGSTDVHLETPFRAIVTASSRISEEKLVHAFRRHNKYKVTSHKAVTWTRTENLLKIGCGIVLVLASGSIVYLLLPSAET